MKNFVIPSIDLLDGKIVRLYKGNYNEKTVYNISIEELLEKYKDFQSLHIVDLNGAKGEALKNIELVKEIRKKFNGIIQLGGGIRSIEIVDKILNEAMIDRVVLGTIAIDEINFTKKIITKFGAEKTVLALDCKLENERFILKTNGWIENSSHDLFDVLGKYKDCAKYILCTDISVDGTMQGANCELYKKIKMQFSDFKLQASGGVKSIADLESLKKVADFAIVGKALYEGLIDKID